MRGISPTAFLASDLGATPKQRPGARFRAALHGREKRGKVHSYAFRVERGFRGSDVRCVKKRRDTPKGEAPAPLRFRAANPIFRFLRQKTFAAGKRLAPYGFMRNPIICFRTVRFFHTAEGKRSQKTRTPRKAKSLRPRGFVPQIRPFVFRGVRSKGVFEKTFRENHDRTDKKHGKKKNPPKGQKSFRRGFSVFSYAEPRRKVRRKAVYSALSSVSFGSSVSSESFFSSESSSMETETS